jgi:glycosyltransferase involved in cell wall biosynthesis
MFRPKRLFFITRRKMVHVLLVTMIKNESRILERLLKSVVSHIDGYVICDTGSTDNTVELAENFIKESGKPGTVIKFPWVNFGVSRTQSVKEAKEWVASVASSSGFDPKHTWGLLLDGDMILPQGIDKNALLSTKASAILLNQKSSNLIYKNTRLLRLDREWTCMGPTHEYWDMGGNQQVSFETPVIQDLDDGGCKSDKFQRDARLLEEELEKNPKHDRTLFYLGQTYQSLGKLRESNEMLQRRIDVGGWAEEIYMAHIYRGDNFINLKEDEKAVCEWLMAWQREQKRTEAAMRLIKYYRNQNNKQFIAMVFLEKLLSLQLGETLVGRPTGYKPVVNDCVLFISHLDLTYSIWEELGILGFYTGQKKGACARLDGEILLLRHDWNVRNNLLGFQKWYDVPLPCVRTKRLRIDAENCPWAKEPDAGIWEAFNPSIRAVEGKYELSLRHSNYSTQDAKHFPYRGRDGYIITRNVLCELDKDLNFIKGAGFKEVIYPKELILYHDHHIQGIEDFRLIQGSSMSLALTTGQQMTPSKINKISCVLWNNETMAVSSALMKLPAGTKEDECQKNWLPFLYQGKPCYVFKINPFIVCDFDAARVVVWMPPVASGMTLDGMRGSAAPVPFKDGTWLMIVHYSHYSDSGRRYYSRFLTLDEELVPLRLSVGFRFSERNIEYVSGLTQALSGDSYLVTYGINDSEAYVAEVSLTTVSKMLCYDLRTGVVDKVMRADFVESF